MCESTNFIVTLNNNEDAVLTANIVEEIASRWIPDYPDEIIHFLEELQVENNIVKVEESYSILSSTFFEIVPQIMRAIARRNFGAITMEAWFTSFSCSYEAEIKGRVLKNGTFRMTMSERE